jgi:hypothetical protein
MHLQQTNIASSCAHPHSPDTQGVAILSVHSSHLFDANDPGGRGTCSRLPVLLHTFQIHERTPSRTQNRTLGRIEAFQRAQAEASAALRRELRAALLRERHAVLAGVAALLHRGHGAPGLPPPLQFDQVPVPCQLAQLSRVLFTKARCRLTPCSSFLTWRPVDERYVPMQDEEIDTMSDGGGAASSCKQRPLLSLPPPQHQQPRQLAAAHALTSHTSQSAPLTCSLQTGCGAGATHTTAASPAAQQPVHSDDARRSPVPRSRQRMRLHSPPPDASAKKRSRLQVSNAQPCLQPLWP